MKKENLVILLWYTATFQTVITIAQQRTIKDMELTGSDAAAVRKLKILTKCFFNSEMEIFIRIDTREERAIRKFQLPAKKKDIDFITKNLNKKEKFVFLIHGFITDSTDDWLAQLSAAYLKRMDVAVFFIDWGTVTLNINYFHVVSRMRDVAREIFNFVESLRNNGWKNSENPIHILGHSLGAHLGSFIGINRFGLIDRITALDPAGPKFRTGEERFSNASAYYTDVIHTSDFYGLYDRLGEVDIYVNGGKVQPGCRKMNKEDENKNGFFERLLDDCSHWKAHEYFTESLKFPNCKFVATRSTTDAEARTKDFDPKKHTVLGVDTFEYVKFPGVYYVNTNRDQPYCRK